MRGPAGAVRRSARLLLVLPLAMAASLEADPIDDYLRAAMAERRIPGLALAVVERGAVTRVATYGLANVETGTVVDHASIFAIASLDKQVTAIGVLRAAELGRLALGDPVGRHVPEVDLPGATLRHLLDHTSGLPDVVAGEVDGRSFASYTTDSLLATVARLVPLARPGAVHHYSDAGLFLAQVATERAAGEPWWSFMRREVFARAGMESPVSMHPAAILPGRVAAYTLERSAEEPLGRLVRDRRLDIDYGPLYTDLGMTVGDFGRLLAALDADADADAGSVDTGASVTATAGRAPLLAPASRALLVEPARLVDGGAAGEVFQWSRYGLGVGLDDFLGEPVVLHSGHSGVGFARFPRRRLAIVVFTNLEHPAGSDPVGLALGVAGRLEPTLSADRLPVAAASDADRTIYAAFFAGEPDLDDYAPGLRHAVWAGTGSLAGRAAWLGPLRTVERLALPTAAARTDGEPATLLRAIHERGTILFRLSRSRDPGGKVTRAVWWHP